MSMDYQHVDNVARGGRRRLAQLKVRVFELESQIETLRAELKEVKAANSSAWDMIVSLAQSVDKLGEWRREHLTSSDHCHAYAEPL